MPLSSHSHSLRSDINQTQHDQLFFMPAEWAPHKATWTSWPFGTDTWSGYLEPVRAEFAALVNTIAQFEPVHLLVADEDTRRSATAHISAQAPIFLHDVPLNDIWFRDNGPIFVKHKQEGHTRAIKWDFNAWGRKFPFEKDNQAVYQLAPLLDTPLCPVPVVLEGGSLDVNGEGLALTTKQCLFNQNRNPNLSQHDLEQHLARYLGIKKVVWLENGLEGDHTDGHIDTIVRFVDARTIVCSMTTDTSDSNYAAMQENWGILQDLASHQGLQLLPLVLPKHKMYFQDERLPCTYANFYVGNGFVVVPQYQDPHDELALETLRSLFPQRTVIGLSSRFLIQGGGSFHCVTQQQPT